MQRINNPIEAGITIILAFFMLIAIRLIKISEMIACWIYERIRG